jgi:hypothetical protein
MMQAVVLPRIAEASGRRAIQAGDCVAFAKLAKAKQQFSPIVVVTSPLCSMTSGQNV